LYSDTETNANELTEKCPFFIDFIPSPEVMAKLYRKMGQVKEVVPQLWQGFNVSQRMDGKVLF
jgi:hypothetical protein